MARMLVEARGWVHGSSAFRLQFGGSRIYGLGLQGFTASRQRLGLWPGSTPKTLRPGPMSMEELKFLVFSMHLVKMNTRRKKSDIDDIPTQHTLRHGTWADLVGQSKSLNDLVHLDLEISPTPFVLPLQAA